MIDSNIPKRPTLVAAAGIADYGRTGCGNDPSGHVSHPNSSSNALRGVCTNKCHKEEE